jgi:hypothetical protein
MLPDDAIAERILSLVKQRGPNKSLCPAEVARSLSPTNWRPLMPEIRRIAQQLSQQQLLKILQHGQPISLPLTLVRGPIRLAGPDYDVDQPPH